MDSIFKEVDTFFKKFEEIKSANEELTQFNGLLQEELQLARDAEKSAEARKARCQNLLLKQAQIIRNLIKVKEENENLKCKIKQTEQTLSTIQNNSIEEQMKTDAKIEQIKEEYLEKITNLQDEADQRVEKEKADYMGTICEMKTSVFQLEKKLEETKMINSSLQEEVQTLQVLSEAFPKLEKTLEEKNLLITSLKEEIESLRACSDANIDVFHKRLAEQERKHQSELEKWKIQQPSLMGFTPSNIISSQFVSSQKYQNQTYQPPQTQRLMQGNQPGVRSQEQMSSHQQAPLVTRYNHNLPRHRTNMVRPLSGIENKNSDFVSANELYLQSLIAGSGREEVEGKGEKAMESKQIMPQKPKVLVPNKKRKLFSSNAEFL